MKKTGDEYLDSKEFRELLASYEEAVSSGQPVFMDAEELAEIADYYQMLGYMDEADEAINLALKLAPGAIAPLTYKIHEALFNNEPEEAERLLNMIIDRSEPDYVYDKGEIMLSKGDFLQADNYFREELENVPADELDDYIIDVASIYCKYNYFQEAHNWLPMVQDKDTTPYKEQLAATLMALGHYEESEALYNQLIDGNPFAKNYWSALASAQFLTEDYPAALQSSEYAIAIDSDDPEAILIKANTLFKLESYEESLEFYHRYSERVPDDELALLHQANCLTNLQRTDEALATLNHALEVAPKDSPYLQDILMEKAFIFCDKKMFQEALSCLENIREESCDPVQLKLIKGHVMLAADRIREAARLFREAVEQSANPYNTVLRILISTLENKHTMAAYKLFIKYFDMVPADTKDGYAYMALCCYELKHFNEFLKYLETGCKVNPNECKMVLAHLFPKDIEPADYYQYIKEKMTL